VDALALIETPLEHTDGYWLGRLTMSMAYAQDYIDGGHADVARVVLRENLLACLASPLPSEELKKRLRGHLK